MTPDIKDSQIYASVSEIKKIISEFPPLESISSIYASMAQASGLNSLNAAANQQQLNVIGTAIVAAGANRILGADPAAKDGKASPDEILACLQKLIALTTTATDQKATNGPDSTNLSSSDVASSKPEDTSA